MIDLDELLAPLADADLGAPPAVDRLRARAEARAARARRRRLAIAGATTAFALVVGTVLVVAGSGRPTGVGTVDPATTAPPAPDPTALDDPVADLPVGRFPYDMLVADGDLWVLNSTSRDVTRISMQEHRVVSTIAFQPGWPGGSPNRLAATDGAVWVGGVSTPDGPGLARIDTATESVTVVPTAFEPTAIAARDDELWVAGRRSVAAGAEQRLEAAVQRVDATTGQVGSAVPVALDGGSLPVDVARTDDGLWVLVQAPGPSPLVRVDPATGAVTDQVDIDAGAVRLVATDEELVVGTDTSGFGGRTGAVTLVDPATRSIVAAVPLDTRPEAIVLVDDLIVTSGLRALDRQTLAERPLPSSYSQLGFAMTGDGSSLWVSVPGAPDGSSTVRRIPVDAVREAVAGKAALGVPAGWQLVDVGDVRFAVPASWEVPQSESCASGAPGVVLVPTSSTAVCSAGSPIALPESVVRIVESGGAAIGTPARLGTLDATLLEPSFCPQCPPTYQLASGLRVSVTGPHAAAVLATFTRSGAAQALAAGPLADRTRWQTVRFGGVRVEVPPDWPVVDLAASSTITTTPDGTTTGMSGRMEPGGCGGDRFGETGVAYLGESEVLPSCPATFVLPVHPGIGLWIRPFPDVGHAMFEARPYDGPSDLDLEVVSGTLDRSVREPVVDVAVDGPDGPVLITIGTRSDPATVRAVLASIRADG
jgi:hypothetical protein